MMRATNPRFLVPTWPALILLFLLLLLLGSPSPVSAGPHAGGALLVHVMEGAYSGDIDYCGVDPITSCEEVVARIDDASSPFVWSIYAVFPETTEPELRGVQFGIEYGSGLIVDTFGHCGDYQDSQGSPWPAGRSGTNIIWFAPQTERLVQVCWFTGYAASLAGGLEFQLTPFPGRPDALFGDNSTAPVIDPVAILGRLGFGEDGEASCPAPAEVLVRADGSGDFPTIGDAVRYSAPGSVVNLEDGIYRGAGNVDMAFNHGLTVRSLSGDPGSCVIDCEGTEIQSHRAFLFTGTAVGPVTIAGIGFVNGYAGPDLSYNAEGGAIKAEYGAHVILRDCVFESCTARSAGAVDGGGGSILVEDCVFRNNRSYASLGGAFGAGWSDDVTVRNCLFESNESEFYGGALAVSGGLPLVENCQFVNNSSVFGGGAMFLTRGNPVLRGCSLTGNLSSRGGAIFGLETDLLLDDCTIAGNLASEGTAIYFDDGWGTVVLEHSIVAGDGGDLFRCGPADWSAQTTCIWDGAGGWPACLAGLEGVWGNFAHDPLFCGTPGREFHLQPTSPCAARSEPRRGVIGAWPVGCSREMAAPERASLALRAEVGEPVVHPNPFRASTQLAYTLTGEEWVRVEIFDISGRRVTTLFEGRGAPGAHSLIWNGKDESGTETPSGPYFARIQTPNATRTIQLLRLR